jgi:hypothetical protein
VSKVVAFDVVAVKLATPVILFELSTITPLFFNNSPVIQSNLTTALSVAVAGHTTLGVVVATGKAVQCQVSQSIQSLAPAQDMSVPDHPDTVLVTVTSLRVVAKALVTTKWSVSHVTVSRLPVSVLIPV